MVVSMQATTILDALGERAGGFEAHGYKVYHAR